MSNHEDDKSDSPFGRNSEKEEYSRTLEPIKCCKVEHKKSIFEAKIIPYEKYEAPNSPLLASSGDNVHIIFTMSKEHFRQLDSNSLKCVLNEFKNMSLFSTDSVVENRSDSSQHESEYPDIFKEMKNLEKIINALDTDNCSDVMAAYEEDKKTDLKNRDKQFIGKLGGKIADSESLKPTKCKEYTQDNANDFILVDKNYQTALKNIKDNEITAVHESSEKDYSIMLHEEVETEKLLDVNYVTEISENLKSYMTEKKVNEVFDKGVTNLESSDKSFAYSQMKSSLYHQVESDARTFERPKEYLPLDESCSAKEISELYSEKNVQITKSSSKKPILNDYVKHVDKMLNSREIQFSSSYFGDDDHSNNHSTNTIFLISSGEPTFYSMRSVGSQVHRSIKKFEEDLESELFNEATLKSSIEHIGIDSEKRLQIPILRNEDGNSLKELDAQEAQVEFSKNNIEDTLNDQNINNRKMIYNEDISSKLKSSDQKQAKEEKSSVSDFNENKDNDPTKSAKPEIDKNLVIKKTVQKNEEKVSFYILTALEKEKLNNNSKCPGALAKKIVQENTYHKKTISDFVRSTCIKTDEESKKCDIFTKITDIDFVDEEDEKSDKNDFTLQNNIESDNNSDFEEKESDTNGILRNEGDEIDCAPTRVRNLEPHIPFNEWVESESPFSRNEKFCNSVIVSGSKPVNRISSLRRSFRSRSLESISSLSFSLTKTPDKEAPAGGKTDYLEKKKKRLSFSGIMSKKDIKSAVVNSTWEITKALIVSPESSPISKKRANSEVGRSSQSLSRSKLRASMDFVKKHTKRGSKVKK